MTTSDRLNSGGFTPQEPTADALPTGFTPQTALPADDLLQAEVDERLKLLDLQAAERLEQSLTRCVKAIIGRMADVSQRITTILTQGRGVRNQLVSLLAQEVVTAADGFIVVPHYEPNAKAKQTVWIYTDAFWDVMDQQLYYDMVNACCQKTGLPKQYGDDPTFMEKLYQQVAFMVAQTCTTAIPKGEAWVNMMNGTLVIGDDGTHTLRPHRREDFIHYVLPYDYNPEADCPRWRAFLDQMLPEPDAQQVLREYIGYCYTHGIKIEKMLVLYGKGSNGKSVVLDIVESLMGSQNVSNVSLSALTTDDEKRTMIESKLVNISHESDKEVDSAVLKLLVSGEPVAARRLYVGTHIMKHYAKLVTSFNILPRAEVTNGFYRRFLILPFRVTIREEEADVDLATKLRGELPGILNWVLEALPGFMQRRAFTPSDVCRQALDRYKMQSDSVRLFLCECVVADDTATISARELFKAYGRYCVDAGLKPIGRNRFYERMEDLGMSRMVSGRDVFYHLYLKDYGIG